MPYELYKVLHLFGIALTLVALGGQLFYVLNGGTKDDAKARGLLMATHGVGLVVVLVAGFGMHAKLGVEGFPGWFVGKLALWAILGGLVAVPWRAPGAVRALWFIIPTLVGIATWLAVYKPF